MRRRLVSTRRRVPASRTDDYRSAWERLRDAVEARGGHTWLFRAADAEDEYLEFIEYARDPGLVDREAVASRRRELDEAFGPGRGEEWIGVYDEEGDDSDGS